MSENNNKTASAGKGIGFTGLLTIAFIVLKLLNIIEWSWLWVLSPIWISVALVILSVSIPLIAALFAAMFAKKNK